MGVKGLFKELAGLHQPIDARSLHEKIWRVGVDMSGLLHRLATRGDTSVQLLQQDCTSLARDVKKWITMLAARISENGANAEARIYCVFDGPPPGCKKVAGERQAKRTKMREMAVALLAEDGQDNAGAGIEDQDDSGDKEKDEDKSEVLDIDSRAGRASLLKKAADGSISITMEAVTAVCAAIEKIEFVRIVFSPNEADSEMAHMHKAGLIDAAVTEDSDLVVLAVPIIRCLRGDKLQHIQLFDIGSIYATELCKTEFRKFDIESSGSIVTLPIVLGRALSKGVSTTSVLAAFAALTGCDFKLGPNVGSKKACIILSKVLQTMDLEREYGIVDGQVGDSPERGLHISPNHLHDIAGTEIAHGLVPSVEEIATCMSAFQLPVVSCPRSGVLWRLIETGHDDHDLLPPCVRELLALRSQGNNSWSNLQDLPAICHDNWNDDSDNVRVLQDFGKPNPWPEPMFSRSLLGNREAEQGPGAQSEVDGESAGVGLPGCDPEFEDDDTEDGEVGRLLEMHALVMARNCLRSAISSPSDLQVLRTIGDDQTTSTVTPSEVISTVTWALSQLQVLIDQGGLTLAGALAVKSCVMNTLLEYVQFSLSSLCRFGVSIDRVWVALHMTAHYTGLLGVHFMGCRDTEIQDLAGYSGGGAVAAGTAPAETTNQGRMQFDMAFPQGQGEIRILADILGGQGQDEVVLAVENVSALLKIVYPIAICIAANPLRPLHPRFYEAYQQRVAAGLTPRASHLLRLVDDVAILQMMKNASDRGVVNPAELPPLPVLQSPATDAAAEQQQQQTPRWGKEIRGGKSRVDVLLGPGGWQEMPSVKGGHFF